MREWVPLRLPCWSAFQWAFLLSLGLHLVVLALRFTPPVPSPPTVFKDSALDVVLINTRSKTNPKHPTALAQRSSVGGGQVAAGHAASPLPANRRYQKGQPEPFNSITEQIATLKKEQGLLLAQTRAQLAQLQPKEPNETTEARAVANQGTSNTAAQQQLLLKVWGQIEQRVVEEEQKAIRKTVGPSTQEKSYAAYYTALRRKVEAQGTLHFPEEGGQKLYGSLTMAMVVNSQGQVVQTQVLKSSGQAALDRQATAIVYTAAPFGEFTPKMRTQAQALEMVTRFVFTPNNNNTLETLPNQGTAAP